MTILFISDLHLSAERPKKLDLFYRFLDGPAKQAKDLYILGDLFEAWVGDDDDTAPNPDILNALSSLSSTGVNLYVMPGNRDFLFGDDFERMSGAKLLPDLYLVDLYGEKTLLMHGDLLCTKDIDYLQFRTMVRNPDWQKSFLAKPLNERLAIAQQLRTVSKEAMQDKIPVIMDVEQLTVENYLRQYQVTQLIHGHTHRPAIHDFNLNGTPAKRTVLGDWYQNENVLVCEETQQKIISINNLINNK